MEETKFSVYQFFPDEQYEKVRESVPSMEAVSAFMHYISSVGARMGATRRVIITDDSDSTNMEWKFEEGIIFPVNEPGITGTFKKGVK